MPRRSLSAVLLLAACSSSPTERARELVSPPDATNGEDASPDATSVEAGSPDATSVEAASPDAQPDGSVLAPEDANAPPLPEGSEPTPTPHGLHTPRGTAVRDLGPAPLDDRLRALIAFPIRDRAVLEATIDALYAPSSPTFRRYPTAAALTERHGPREEDVARVTAHLAAKGFDVARIGTNRLFVEIIGTVAAFEATFGARLRRMERQSIQEGADPHVVYGLLEGQTLTAPAWMAARIAAVVTADSPAEEKPLSTEGGEVEDTPPPDRVDTFTPREIARAYGFDTLGAAGFDGSRSAIGVVVGATFKRKDVASFWRGFGIERAMPIEVPTMEPIATRYAETTLDVEWSGAMAPGAKLVVYQGPDSRQTSMVYTFAEAIARGEVRVVTDSFAHREEGEPLQVRLAYHASATWAAALGITVIGAGGDSAGPDVPSSSPYATSVGGTVLRLNADGSFASETAWPSSGSGESLTFARPPWQSAVAPDATMRMTSDVSINAGGMWEYYLGSWEPSEGTSFSAPTFAAGIAVVNDRRAAKGLPPVGWLSPVLYRDPVVQSAFRDVTAGGTDDHPATTGWDPPTGWGSPNFAKLADVLP